MKIPLLGITEGLALYIGGTPNSSGTVADTGSFPACRAITWLKNALNPSKWNTEWLRSYIGGIPNSS